MSRTSQSVAFILAVALAFPAAAAPAASALPIEPAERAQTCFYAAVAYSRASVGLQRAMTLQYFVYVAARAAHGAAVTLADLDATAAQMNDAAKVRQAAPLISACQEAYPLSRGRDPVVLPADPVQIYAICQANGRTLANLAGGVAQAASSEDEKQGAEAFRDRAVTLAERLVRAGRDVVRTGGIDQAQLTERVDTAVARLPDVGRPDRVFEACQRAFPR